jgi:FkbM family methyltransferase
MVDRQSSNRQPQKTNPRLDPDTKRRVLGVIGGQRRIMNRVAVHQVDRVLRRTLPPIGAQRMLLKWRAWQAARFGEPEIRLLRYLVDPMRAAIDIGAAEGVYAVFLQGLAQRCIAFEPNPGSYLCLKSALPEVEIHQAAVSAVEGDATLRVPVVNGIPYTGWATIEPKNQFPGFPPHVVEEIKVRTVRPDRMALGDIGFVKIDVEGHELDVLAGLSGLLAKCLPTLLIEIGGAQRGASLAEIRDCLDPLGYIGLRLDDNGLLKAPANEAEVRGSPNVMFIPAVDHNPVFARHRRLPQSSSASRFTAGAGSCS